MDWQETLVMVLGIAQLLGGGVLIGYGWAARRSGLRLGGAVAFLTGIIFLLWSMS